MLGLIAVRPAREAHEAFAVDVDAQGIITGDQDVPGFQFESQWKIGNQEFSSWEFFWDDEI